jgi:UDP-glucose 4-epimerase
VQVESCAESPYADALVHLAEESVRSRANSGGEAYCQSAVRTVEELCAKRFPIIIYASSGAVYGDDQPTPRRVGDPTRADDVYSRIKLECEQVVLRSGGIIVRLSNLYGPGMDPSSVLAHVLSQLRNPGPVQVQDGRPVRDFLWVDDAAAIFGDLLERPLRSTIVNAGTGISTSIRDLAQMAVRLAGEADRQVAFVKAEGKASINGLDPDETKITCGWSPRTPLEAGLQRLLRAALRACRTR